MIAMIVGLASAAALALILSGFSCRTNKHHHDGVYVSQSYRNRLDRQCRTEFDANRLMVR
jgi:hypothetical protein